MSQTLGSGGAGACGPAYNDTLIAVQAGCGGGRVGQVSRNEGVETGEELRQMTTAVRNKRTRRWRLALNWPNAVKVHISLKMVCFTIEKRF